MNQRHVLYKVQIKLHFNLERKVLKNCKKYQKIYIFLKERKMVQLVKNIFDTYILKLVF